MAIKVNNQSIQKIMLGSIPVKRIYEDLQIVFDTGGTPQPCFEVVDVISQASGDYVDVYVNNEAKWYKRNNLNQYEEYGIMPIVDDLSTLTYYTGKLAILNTDVHEYKWNGSTWVDIGAAGSLTEYIFMDPPTSNTYRVSFPIRYYFGEGYKMKIFMYVTGTFSGDTGGFLNFSSKSPIEFNQYSNGFYVDYHNPTSTTSPSVYSGDYSTRVMAQGALNNYKDTKLIFEIENNRVTVTNFDTGTQIYTGGSLATVTGWYDGLYEPVYTQGNNNPSHVAYIQIYDNNGNLVNDLRPKYNANPSDVKDTVTWYDSVIDAEYYNDNSYAANYHKESIGDITPVEDYDTKVAPANNVHYNTLEELELMECPWVGMIATIGQDNIYYEYTDEGWVLADMPLNLPYLRFTTSQDSTFTFNENGLKYSINGSPWNTLTANVSTGLVTAGSYIIFKGRIPKIDETTWGRTFSATGNFSASGNIMSILYDDDFTDKTSLADTSKVFRSLFSGCSKLTSISNLSLPATTLGYQCYNSMFSSTGITSIPSGFLPATDLSGCDSCYSSMFSSTGITSIPSGLLPATVLANSCYNSMFRSTNITSIPSGLLPATVLTNSCYDSIFYGCKQLVSADIELPAANVPDYAYQGMFREDNNLIDPPIIKATSATGTYCMRYMFLSCSKLKYVVSSVLTEPSSSTTYQWLSGVSATGTFYKDPSATWDHTITRGVDTVPSGWTIVDDHQGNVNYLKFTTVDDNGSTYMFNKPTEYSIDNGSWTALSASTNSPLVPKDHEIRFRGNITPSGNYGQINLTTSGKFNASGEIMTLLYGDKYYGQQSKAIIRTFYRFFYQSNIVSAENLILPEFTLAPQYVFADMFNGSQYLTIAPNVRAVQTNGYAFRNMFQGCTSLTTVQDVYCGNTATESHVGMFKECTALTSIDFNVTATTGWTLQSICEGCTSLQTAIVRGDFTYQYVANYLFKNCTSLTSLTYLGTQSPGTGNRTNDWLLNAPATGTFYMDQNKTWDSTVPRTASGVPSGWTIVKIDPSSV